MIKELGPGFRLTLIFTILLGLLYPVVMTGISQLIFPRQANGSLDRFSRHPEVLSANGSARSGRTDDKLP